MNTISQIRCDFLALYCLGRPDIESQQSLDISIGFMAGFSVALQLANTAAETLTDVEIAVFLNEMDRDISKFPATYTISS